MLRPTARLAALLAAAALAAPPVLADAFDDLKARMQARLDAPGVSLFPDPQDEALTRIRFEPDQVTWLFREALRHRTEGGVLEGMLADALEQKHRRHAWALTRRLREDAGRARKHFRRAVAEPPQPEDLAAFVPVFERLPTELRDEFSAAEMAAQQAAASLQDPSTRAAYLARCATQDRPFARRGWLTRQGKKLAKGVGGLVDRLELRFSKENLIRFFARVAGATRFDSVRGRAREALADLQADLQRAVLRDLDDQLEGGVGESIQSIEEVGGGIRTKSSLTRGRLRLVLKLMDALRDSPQDLRLFLPTLRVAARGVKQRLRSAQGETRDYLAKLDQTLETAETLLRLAARKPDAPGARMPLVDAIWSTLRAEDFEGLFAELDADPDLL